jgi:replicative DNA helicase
MSNHLATTQAEKTILGAILMTAPLVHEAAQFVSPDDFLLDSHRCLFARMLELGRDGKPIDHVTLTDVLERGKELEAVGGVPYIFSLIDGVPPMPSVTEYSKMVRDASRTRGLMAAASNVITRAEDGEGPDELLGQMQQSISELVGRGSRKGARQLPEIGISYLNNLAAIRKMDSNQTIGLTTSLPGLDQDTTGIRKSELWVIGARPAVGKSALARQIAIANAKQGKRVVVFTIEMTSEQQLGCAVALHSEGTIPFFKLRDPRLLDSKQFDEVGEMTAELCRLPLVFDETSNLGVPQLLASARLHAAQGADLFIVDYLQKMRGEPRQSTLDRVAAASNAVCELAKSTGVPVIALSQLRKAASGQEDKEPTVEDLKETSEILQDAATVILLHRPVESAANINPKWRPAVMFVPKQRFGDSDLKYDLIFNKRTVSFEEAL